MQPLRLLLPAADGPGRAVLLLAAALASGCGDDEGASCPQEGDLDCSAAHETPLTLEVGTGDPEHPDFEPLPADGHASLFPGPQQGYHVFLQVRATGVCPNRIVIKRKIREPGLDPVIRSQEERLPMVDGQEGTWVLPRAQPTFICPSNMPGVEMAGRPLDLEVTLTEELGACDRLEGGARTVTEHVTIVPTCAETDTLCSEDWVAGCAAPP